MEGLVWHIKEHEPDYAKKQVKLLMDFTQRVLHFRKLIILEISFTF